MPRSSRNAPRETESGPKTSPLARLAAKTVTLGAFRGIRGAAVPQVEPRANAPIPGLAFLEAPRGTWNPPPRHLLAFEFTR